MFAYILKLLNICVEVKCVFWAGGMEKYHGTCFLCKLECNIVDKMLTCIVKKVVT